MPPDLATRLTLLIRRYSLISHSRIKFRICADNKLPSLVSILPTKRRHPCPENLLIAENIPAYRIAPYPSLPTTTKNCWRRPCNTQSVCMGTRIHQSSENRCAKHSKKSDGTQPEYSARSFNNATALKRADKVSGPAVKTLRIYLRI